MKKLLGMSNLGYAIILVIIIAIGMIISTPMIINNAKNKVDNSDIKNQPENIESPEYDKNMDYNASSDPTSVSVKEQGINNNSSKSNDSYVTYSEVKNLDQRLSSRIDSVEIKQNELMNNIQSKSNVADKYVCSIEGRLDSENNVVPIDNQQSGADLKSQKFVFVCQYK